MYTGREAVLNHRGSSALFFDRHVAEPNRVLPPKLFTCRWCVHVHASIHLPNWWCMFDPGVDAVYEAAFQRAVDRGVGGLNQFRAALYLHDFGD